MIKKYLKKLMIEVINENIPRVEMQDLIIESPGERSNILQKIKFFDVTEITLKIEYLDENNQVLQGKVSAKTASEFKQKIEQIENFIPQDIISFKTLDIQVWYNYKGERRLEVERYLGWTGNYDYKVIKRTQGSILRMFKENPEMLL